MHLISLARRQDVGYQGVCEFAQDHYRRELALEIHRFPDYVFTVHDKEGSLRACMGLNRSVSCPLFIFDSRLPEAGIDLGDESFGEQSVFVFMGSHPSIIALTSVVAGYARYIGIKKLAFGAIDISLKLMGNIGVGFRDFGPVDLSGLPPEHSARYQKWSQKKGSRLVIADVSQAGKICHETLARMNRKVKLEDDLARTVHDFS